MKRRIDGLASSAKAAKPRAWKEDKGAAVPDGDEDDDDDEPAPPPPPPKPPKPPGGVRAAAKPRAGQAPKPADSDEEAYMALEAALDDGEGDAQPPPPTSGPNPVVWMDISVAGKARGRVHFELFKDAVPETAENFRLLCVGATPGGRSVGYKGSEIHKVVPGRLVEGGEFDSSATGEDFKDESFKLTHAKAGLLSMVGTGPDANASRFQVVLRPSHELDNKQVVFGQILPSGPGGDAGDKLNALHWVEAVGNLRTGTPREAVVVEDCGELPAEEAAQLVGAKPNASESQESRYSRGGLRPPKLAEAVQRENLGDVLELTADALDSWEWEVQKASRAGDGQERAKEIEFALNSLSVVLEEAKYRAGTVQGPEGKHGRNAQSQQLRAKELQESLQKLY